jgi:hypothetical protein
MAAMVSTSNTIGSDLVSWSEILTNQVLILA